MLDGGWANTNPREDRDAPRRLFYVAMTRARQTLALTRMTNEKNPFADELGKSPLVLCRETPPDTAPGVEESPSAYLAGTLPSLMAQYQRLDMETVDLGFAGRHYRRNPVHRAIRALAPGHVLELRAAEDSRWELFNASGRRVGRLSGKFKHPGDKHCCRASVFAVVQWSKEQSEPQYLEGIRCDSEWEVVVPELVFLPR